MFIKLCQSVTLYCIRKFNRIIELVYVFISCEPKGQCHVKQKRKTETNFILIHVI